MGWVVQVEPKTCIVDSREGSEMVREWRRKKDNLDPASRERSKVVMGWQNDWKEGRTSNAQAMPAAAAAKAFCFERIPRWVGGGNEGKRIDVDNSTAHTN